MADYTGNAVKFKLGTQASLNALKDSQKGWEVGTFYLTSSSSFSPPDPPHPGGLCACLL